MRNGDSKLSAFTSRRRGIDLAARTLVKVGRLDPEQPIPVVVEPVNADVDLVSWAQANLQFIDAALYKEGAIIFRGFNVASISEFQSFAKATSSELMDYSEPSTPRTQLAEKVYTSTEYPNTETLPLHNEMSYSHVWPMKVWFHCVKPADQGGETPIADSRRVFQLMEPEIKRRFIEKKVLYVRNYDKGVGLSWQSVFHTDSKDELEQYCHKVHIECEWMEGGRLRTRQVRQAVANHPRTGETVWFNQAHIHNILNLPPDFRESLLTLVDSKEFPLDINSFYGDGTPIEPSVFESIHNAYRQAAITFPWEKGDVMMLDNMLTAHARAPFVGTRKIVVAMAEPYS